MKKIVMLIFWIEIVSEFYFTPFSDIQKKVWQNVLELQLKHVQITVSVSTSGNYDDLPFLLANKQLFSQCKIFHKFYYD